MSLVLIVSIASSLLRSAHAVSFYTNGTIPTNLTLACTNALTADVDCDPVVPALRNGNFYPDSTLTRACTPKCANALASFQNNVASACNTDTWLGYDNETMPLTLIPDLLRFHYNLTCITNNGAFCNNVAAAYAAYLDPNTTDNTAPANGQYGNITVTDACDLCLIKNLKFQAESPYYDGPDLWSSSIYESKTSSCQVTGMDLTSMPLTLYTPTSTADTPNPTCSGKPYTLKPGDDCHSVSLSQGISTSWLLQDNALNSHCVDFPTSGALCLKNTCKVYTVQANDTCDSISVAQNITVPQLKAWNPNINAGCYNIEFMIGDQLCVAKPGTPYLPPPTTSLAPTIPTTPAPIPTDVAEGTNTDCGLYYRAVMGDFCNQLILKFGITLSDFVFLNPAINDNCTNLFADESYCISAVGDINTYPGRPGYVSYTATITSLVGDPATRWPTITYTTPTRTATLQRPPLATDTRDDCFQYFDGASYVGKVEGASYYKSDCDLAAHVFQVSLDDLAVWNPSLGNTSLSNCTFQAGDGYCGQYWIGDTPVTTVADTGGDPIRDNTTENCTRYVDVFDGSGFTCQDILDDFNITIAQFYAWNPAVGADCSNLWLSYQYCVAGPALPGSTPTSTMTPTSTIGPGAPTQTGQPANCNKWYIVKSGDSCATVENTYFITSAQFLAWNPSVSSDCSTGFWADYAYCVGTTDTISSTRSTPAATTTTTSAASPSITAPDPHQDNNAVSNCNKYAQVKDGDYCYIFAQNNGITTEQLYSWNAVLGSDGSGCDTSFWLGYWYCVGVSS
ncbi:hypothetical protein F4824DRAFT_294880 [Ustulina deusta]|nr:hypothetical protein F4824DRAFT_294880 [Ustulina deusta]